MSCSSHAPRHAGGVRLRESSGGGVLISTRGRSAFVLDHTALALWELCDGETTVEEMASAASAIFDAPPTTLQQDIAAALTAMAEAGLLEWVRVRPRVDGCHLDAPAPGVNATTDGKGDTT